MNGILFRSTEDVTRILPSLPSIGNVHWRINVVISSKYKHLKLENLFTNERKLFIVM